MLDVGATIGGPASQYAQFAVMGAAYGRAIFDISNPTIGLLNIGVEDVKGTDSVREAAELLARSELNFTGFIEGDGIGRGDADVIVTDGFTGNIALKTAEGTARQIAEYLRQAMGGSVFQDWAMFCPFRVQKPAPAHGSQCRKWRYVFGSEWHCCKKPWRC